MLCKTIKSKEFRQTKNNITLISASLRHGDATAEVSDPCVMQNNQILKKKNQKHYNFSKYKIHSGEFVEFDKDFAISLVLCVIVGPRDLTSLLHWHTQAPTLGPIHAPLLCYRPQCDARTVKPWPNNQMGAGLSGNPASPKLKRCG